MIRTLIVDNFHNVSFVMASGINASAADMQCSDLMSVSSAGALVTNSAGQSINDAELVQTFAFWWGIDRLDLDAVKTPVTPELMKKFDLIVAVDGDIYKELLGAYPQMASHIVTLQQLDPVVNLDEIGKLNGIALKGTAARLFWHIRNNLAIPQMMRAETSFGN